MINKPIYLLVKMWHMTRVLRESLGISICRFYPSCSDYLLDAIKKHGLLKGLSLFFKRIVKCHPLCEGGIDEVPAIATCINRSQLGS